MKKLIIAAAIVCAAVASQASSCAWSVSAAKAQDGQIVYLLTAISSEYTSLKAFADTAIDYGTVSKVGVKYKIATRTPTDKSVTTTANYYLAIVDGNTITYLDVSTAMRATVYDPPSPAPEAYTAAFADIAGSTTTAEIVPEPTPEPTSAMLMLLGVAGLALRRKRA